MKKPVLAAVAAALTVGSTSLWAMAGDSWRGSNVHGHTMSASSAEITRAQTPGVIAYEERIVSSPVVVERAPVVVEREYVVMEPRERVYVAYADPRPYDPLFPERGPWIGDGLFNEEGPNDFGQ